MRHSEKSSGGTQEANTRYRDTYAEGVSITIPHANAHAQHRARRRWTCPAARTSTPKTALAEMLDLHFGVIIYIKHDEKRTRCRGTGTLIPQMWFGSMANGHVTR